MADKLFWLWALPEGKHDRLDEQPLTSFPLISYQVEKIKTAATKDGWHGFRTYEDTNEIPDFAGAVLSKGPKRKRNPAKRAAGRVRSNRQKVLGADGLVTEIRMTAEEWKNTHPDYKDITAGQRYALTLDTNGATVSVPVRIVKKHAPPEPARYNTYNMDAVDKAIASSSRFGPKIGKKEGAAIHRLLRGWRGNRTARNTTKRAAALPPPMSNADFEHLCRWAVRQFRDDERTDMIAKMAERFEQMDRADQKYILENGWPTLLREVESGPTTKNRGRRTNRPSLDHFAVGDTAIHFDNSKARAKVVSVQEPYQHGTYGLVSSHNGAHMSGQLLGLQWPNGHRTTEFAAFFRKAGNR